MNFLRENLIIIFLHLISANYCIIKTATTINKPAVFTYKAWPTGMKTTSSTSSKLTKISPVSFFECYQKNQENSVEYRKTCTTSCYTLIKTNEETLFEHRGCNMDKICSAGVYMVQNDSFIIFDCCRSNLCNSQNNTQTKLNFTCEFNKKVNRTKQKLIYPANFSSNISVTKCYACNSCASFKYAKIAHCGSNSTNIDIKYSCQLSYSVENQTYLWSASCAILSESFFLTYEKFKSKTVSCQYDLCNTPQRFNRLKNATLCKEGFYA